MDQLTESVLHAVLRAESDNQVPRVVAALESIAESLEKIASVSTFETNSRERTGTGDFVEARLAHCSQCGRAGPLNIAGWCLACFSGETPRKT